MRGHTLDAAIHHCVSSMGEVAIVCEESIQAVEAFNKVHRDLLAKGAPSKKVLHLALYAKKERTRNKNISRIFKNIDRTLRRTTKIIISEGACLDVAKYNSAEQRPVLFVR